MGIDVRWLYYTHETPVTPEEPDSIRRPFNTEVQQVLRLKCLIYYVFSLKKEEEKRKIFAFTADWHNQSFDYNHCYKRQETFSQE